MSWQNGSLTLAKFSTLLVYSTQPFPKRLDKDGQSHGQTSAYMAKPELSLKLYMWPCVWHALMVRQNCYKSSLLMKIDLPSTQLNKIGNYLQK
jgi:hypothetical protein